MHIEVAIARFKRAEQEVATISREAAFGDIRLAVAFEDGERVLVDISRGFELCEIDFDNACFWRKTPAISRSAALIARRVLRSGRHDR